MVRKFYRDLPYHNWDHAFSVAQYMFAVLQLVWDRFDPLHVSDKVFIVIFLIDTSFWYFKGVEIHTMQP